MCSLEEATGPTAAPGFFNKHAFLLQTSCKAPNRNSTTDEPSIVALHVGFLHPSTLFETNKARFCLYSVISQQRLLQGSWRPICSHTAQWLSESVVLESIVISELKKKLLRPIKWVMTAIKTHFKRSKSAKIYFSVPGAKPQSDSSSKNLWRFTLGPSIQGWRDDILKKTERLKFRTPPTQRRGGCVQKQ